jgi:pyruvate dehydrogenase E1 component
MKAPASGRWPPPWSWSTCWQTAGGQGFRQIHRAHHPGRGPHLRHGVAVPQGIGIYSHIGQNYEPVDKESLLYYKEAKDGQILEEGITEAGSMSSFIAAGTAYSTHGINMIPFFFFYSMFGFQRIGDLIWAAGDAQARGFLLGGTSGRTTLAGEGLQHQDGHSHVLAYGQPVGAGLRSGLRLRDRGHRPRRPAAHVGRGEDVVYYLTVMNEFYPMPAMPEGVEEGILKGIYKFRARRTAARKSRRICWQRHHLERGARGPGAAGRALRRRRRCLERHQLQKPLLGCRFHRAPQPAPPGRRPQPCYLQQQLAGEKGVFVAASDYLKALPAMVAKWIPGEMFLLGTDGYGRSDGRPALRDFFEVDARHIAYGLARGSQVKSSVVKKAAKQLNVDPEKIDPLNT